MTSKPLPAFFAGVDEPEHLHKRGVSRIGDTTGEHNVQGDAQTAGVLDFNPVGIAQRGHAAAAVIIAVNKTVDESLAHGGVHFGVLHPLQRLA